MLRLVAGRKPGAGAARATRPILAARPGRRPFDARGRQPQRDRACLLQLRRSITIGAPQPCGANSGVTTIAARAQSSISASRFSTSATSFPSIARATQPIHRKRRRRRIARRMRIGVGAQPLFRREAVGLRPSNARPPPTCRTAAESPFAPTARSKPEKDEARSNRLRVKEWPSPATSGCAKEQLIATPARVRISPGANFLRENRRRARWRSASRVSNEVDAEPKIAPHECVEPERIQRRAEQRAAKNSMMARVKGLPIST